ncbi:MAG: D-alanine--D-alanine ligase [Bacteroidetes bacterium]|nr:MAG: D-alanine--D-alanine ligase [Bacteroidota bacterium]
MIKVAILFGGSSREREVSFSGGRTVYDNLDKTKFEAIPIFVDSFNNLVELDWQYVYKGSIRDFYPPIDYLPDSPHAYQIYAESLNLNKEAQLAMLSSIGKPIRFEELAVRADLVFLALHGSFAEDGTIQGLLEWHGIPYTGSGIFASSFGINKKLQKQLFEATGLVSPDWLSVKRAEWQSNPEQVIQKVSDHFTTPFLVKSAKQGSSLGISVVQDKRDLTKALHKSFFIHELTKSEWDGLSEPEQVEWVRSMADIREGLGMPLLLNAEWVFLPEDLLAKLKSGFAAGASKMRLEAKDGESEVVVEDFIEGREFSCIVVQDTDAKPVALPPTEIVKGKELFDYRSKYLPGLSRKLTPIDLPLDEIERIRQSCVAMFAQFNFNVYARIDGFYTADGKVLLNDPNTTSGMMPSSFFFHQAAEIGLNPSDFLTYIIETSLKERVEHANAPQAYQQVLSELKNSLDNAKEKSEKIRVAVVMGGYSSERHISVESGRNIFEKLSSSSKYDPIPVFLTGNDEAFELHLLPTNIMLKDNADDIKEKVLHFYRHPAMEKIVNDCQSIRDRYKSDHAVMIPKHVELEELKTLVDEVFIALHGRPGEDGALQEKLEKIGLPYNGSGVTSSRITINKYDTNRKLESAGFLVAKAVLVEEDRWSNDRIALLKEIEETCSYPLIAKPADDGCSSAVKKINSASELAHFAELIFRQTEALPAEAAAALDIDPKEEVPMKRYFLVEELIGSNGAQHFLEITGGLLTHNEQGTVRYEIFEASESLAEKGILSLAEKFLAGQGQNITPARYAKDAIERQRISDEVRKTFEAAAKVLQIEGYARIDAFVRIFSDGRVEVIFIEVNSLPGMTPATCIFHQTAINGYKPLDFIDQILEYGKYRLTQNQ